MKIGVLFRNPAQIAQIRELLQPETEQEIQFLQGGIEDLALLAEPELTIVDIGRSDTSALPYLERWLAKHPDRNIILLSDEPSGTLLIQAMRLGVRDVIPYPIQDKELLEAVRRASGRGKADPGSPLGKTFACVAGKGGGGATFLATNLAYAIASHSKLRVAILDLNLPFGDAALCLTEQAPRLTLSDLTRDTSRLDQALLATAMVQVTPNLHLLAAPEDPAAAMEIDAESIGAILALVKSQYDLVFMDLGRHLDALNVRALDEADRIFLVLQQTVPFVHNAKRLASAFKSLGYPDEKVRLILNRQEKKAELSPAEVEQAVGLIHASIPNSYGQITYAINRGMALHRADPNNVAVRALNQMAEQLIQEFSPAQHKPTQSRAPGWLSRFRPGGTSALR